MSVTMRGGVPRTFRYDVDPDGGQYSLDCLSSELIFRPQSGAGSLYWTEKDYKADENFVELNGDSYSGEFRLRASVHSIWLRGPMEVELTVLGQF